MNNVALVPLHLLPYKERWQVLANALPFGGILCCQPSWDCAEEQYRWAWDAIVRSIRAAGHQVLVVTVEDILGGA